MRDLAEVFLRVWNRILRTPNIESIRRRFEDFSCEFLLITFKGRSTKVYVFRVRVRIESVALSTAGEWVIAKISTTRLTGSFIMQPQTQAGQRGRGARGRLLGDQPISANISERLAVLHDPEKPRTSQYLDLSNAPKITPGHRIISY